MKIIARNKKGSFNYQHLDTVEAGMSLRGWQVKSIKAGNISINEAYVYIHKNEIFLKGATIADWPGMGEFEHKSKGGDVKLLMRKAEIERWQGKLLQKQATTVVPLKIYEVRGKIKIEIALAKGMKQYDKRAKVKDLQQKRDIQRELKQDKYF